MVAYTCPVGQTKEVQGAGWKGELGGGEGEAAGGQDNILAGYPGPRPDQAILELNHFTGLYGIVPTSE